MKTVINVYQESGTRHRLKDFSEPHSIKKQQHEIAGFYVAGGYCEEHKIMDRGLGAALYRGVL